MAVPARSSGAEVIGLAQFRRQLALAPAELASELKKAHKDLADRAAEWSRYEAASLGRQQATAIDRIRGTSTPLQARITVSNTNAVPYASAAYWGAKRHTGWYGAAKYDRSTGKQFLPWVGNSWDVAVAGQGPYGINAALAKHMDDLVDFYDKAINSVLIKTTL